MDYTDFIAAKTQLGGQHGFEPVWMPNFLFGFQAALASWSIRKGRGAIFANCGTGKTPMQLVWAQNVVQHTNKPVLILTPLAVAPQTVREGHKFGIECAQSRDGSIPAKITVTNYQQLGKFRWQDFAGVVCDESAILRNFDGKLKDAITEFMRKLPFRLLLSATPAPNNFIELGTSSEALGDLGYMDMLAMFFKNAQNSLHPSVYRNRGSDFARMDEGAKFRFRGHAEKEFWRWVCSWARACRMPSDMGFPDDGYKLPPLITTEHTVKASKPRPDMLFDLPAHGLKEQRDERRRTINERCEMAAQIHLEANEVGVAWCHLNPEGKLLKKLIPGSVEVCGGDSDEAKEEAFEAFASGQIKTIISKPVIAGYGLNWEFCSRQTFFPSHSFSEWYQAIRRSWRFGQTRPVHIDMIASEGEADVLKNLNRKAAAAEQMMQSLVGLMNNELQIHRPNAHTKPIILPPWLKAS